MPTRRRYKVIFHNKGQLYELYAKSVSQGSLFGFVEVEDLLFGERTSVVVDPAEESLKVEFKGVKRIHVPLHAIVRIEEVEKEGVSRIAPAPKGDNVANFPAPIYGKPGRTGEE